MWTQTLKRPLQALQARVCGFDALTGCKACLIAFALAPASAAIVISLASTSPAVAAKKKSSQSIVVLVNDDPITAYEIDQRKRFLSLSSGGGISKRARANFQRLIKQESTNTELKAILKRTIAENRGSSRDEIKAIFDKQKKAFAQKLQKRAVAQARASVLPKFSKKARDQLIDERLKVQAAKQLNVAASNEEVRAAIEKLAQRNKMNYKQFKAHMRKLGVDISTLELQVRARLSWTQVIRRRFGHQISVSSGHVERYVDPALLQSASAAAAELKLQRITLLTDAANQESMGKRLQEASGLQQKFTGCKSTANLAKSLSNAKFEDLGSRQSSSLPEPTRSMALNAKQGEMLPPSIGANGVELWIVCGRKAAPAAVGSTAAAPNPSASRRAKEFNLLAKRHLKDLRHDAHIEYR